MQGRVGCRSVSLDCEVREPLLQSNTRPTVPLNFLKRFPSFPPPDGSHSEREVISVCMNFPNEIWEVKGPAEVAVKVVLMTPIILVSFIGTNVKESSFVLSLFVYLV